MRTIGIGQASIAVAGAGLAILSLAYRDFAPMWHTIPAGIPRRETWVFGSALLVMVASAGLCLSRTALAGALMIAAYQGVWAVTGLPPILAAPLSVGSWNSLAEALTSLAGTGIVVATLRWPLQGSRMSPASERVVHLARVVFGLSCAFYGYSHFAYADYTAGMVPTWLPCRLAFAYFTGLSYIAAGVGIVVGILPRLASTLVAIMMSLFGLLVWVPTLFAYPKPGWATPAQNQWSELEVNLLLAASAWIVAESLKDRRWGFSAWSRD